MNYVPEFRKLLDFVEGSLSGTKIVTKKSRDKVALSLMNVTLDHAQGICTLLERGVFPPSMALQRDIFETSIRSIWIQKYAGVLMAQNITIALTRSRARWCNDKDEYA